MPIVSMKEILNAPKEGRYADGSYNPFDHTMIRGVIQAAESVNAPVILSHAPAHFKFTPLDSVVNIMRYEASRAKVPVALILDHGHKVEGCIDAMKAGLSAVMMDASSEPYDENVGHVKQVVEFAHSHKCDVEAELGHVTRPESGESEVHDDFSAIYDDSLYTQPDEAAKFVKATGVDALAVAIGTAHGVYHEDPVLDLDRLIAIREAVDVPLVMHGGSGLSDADFKNAIRCGIQKINYFTGLVLHAGGSIKAFVDKTGDHIFYHDVMMETIAAIKEDIIRSMKIFGCDNKA